MKNMCFFIAVLLFPLLVVIICVLLSGGYQHEDCDIEYEVPFKVECPTESTRSCILYKFS